MDPYATYDNPLIVRYATRAMSELWSPRRKFSTWRRLWIALAEAERELGLEIATAQIDELKAHIDDIDFDAARRHEKRLRHDVMAHVHAYGDVAPNARPIIHLGATSCYVTDNTDLILIREALGLVRDGLVGAIDALADFALRWKDLPCLGYTHFQPAQLVTVGKRATLWCHELILDLGEVERRLSELKFLGVKGTTGTQASFLALFDGDHTKVEELDRRVAAAFDFDASYPVSGQTYSRKVDTQVLAALSGVAESAHRFGTDLRLLAHEREVEEPFESDQIGSSAMAYKRNPMRAERMCSLGRFAMGQYPVAAQTAATQWLERIARRQRRASVDLAADVPGRRCVVEPVSERRAGTGCPPGNHRPARCRGPSVHGHRKPDDGRRPGRRRPPGLARAHSHATASPPPTGSSRARTTICSTASRPTPRSAPWTSTR